MRHFNSWQFEMSTIAILMIIIRMELSFNAATFAHDVFISYMCLFTLKTIRCQ